VAQTSIVQPAYTAICIFNVARRCPRGLEGQIKNLSPMIYVYVGRRHLTLMTLKHHTTDVLQENVAAPRANIESSPVLEIYCLLK